MARRKFKRSATHRRRSGVTKTRSRRRRMGATSALNLSANSPLVQWGSIALGFFMPDLIPVSQLVGDKVDGKIVAVGEAGIGFLLSQRKKKGRGIMAVLMTAGGGYLMGAGIKKGLQEFGIMTGISPYGRVNVVNGMSPYGRVNVINGGMSPNRTLAGGFSPNRTINKVMTGLGNDASSGSGLTSNVPGSTLMN